ncbi:MAG TPA: crosslink repair DNA glycosylase YcaQ family protein [Amnibacterium sp.]|jgi:hypothetical protein|uniref:DNA glycosylase AlkZ-like family protein n=1 Tax=Amnibacterium sp. TaxID=1872496 RepID=UPI002F951E7F
MTPEELRARRLAGQRLAPRADRPVAGVVRALGAVQSQDLPGALLAVGQRSGATAAEVLAALDRGEVLRTHVLRPTWHLVAPEDLRPYVAATGVNVQRAAAPQLRRAGLDDARLRRLHEVVADRLRDGPATRPELATALDAAGVAVDGVGLANGIIHAESAAVLCSGPARERTQTYALVEDRTPPGPLPPRKAVLADLARRYLTTRGPATPADFRWWSGLNAADARLAVDAVRDEFERSEEDGRELLWPPGEVHPAEGVLLLPNFDEYVVAYADRAELLEERHRPLLDSRRNPIFQHVVVAAGAVVGTWSVAARARRLELTARLFEAPSAGLTDALEAAAVARYAAFREREVVLVVT